MCAKSVFCRFSGPSGAYQKAQKIHFYFIYNSEHISHHEMCSELNANIFFIYMGSIACFFIASHFAPILAAVVYKHADNIQYATLYTTLHLSYFSIGDHLEWTHRRVQAQTLAHCVTNKFFCWCETNNFVDRFH